MPNRIIKESVCTSESVNGLSWFEEAFFYRLIVNCDDYGRFDARPAILKARLFPLKNRITEKDVSSALTKLADAGIVRLYNCDSKPYLYLPTWEVHQTIRAKKSRYPAPDGKWQADESICMQMQADVPVIQSESKKENREKKVFKPPSLEEVRDYCAEKGLLTDPKKFWDYYEAGEWVDSRGNPVKNWKLKLQSWESKLEKPKPRREGYV